MWRPEIEKRPEVFGFRNLAMALGLHLALFSLFWTYSWVHDFFNKPEEIQIIDLTVVVNENLDGKDDEPPPLQKPTPPPPRPEPEAKPTPKPKIEEPKPLERMVVEKPVEKPKKKVEKEKPKPPEPPKKTKEELRKERLEKMRKEAKVVDGKKVKIEVKAPSGNGRTERQTLTQAEIMKMLALGYRPDRKTQIAADELSRCLSLIKRALDAKWNRLSPRIGSGGQVVLSVQFNSNGGMINVKLVRSCGDRLADAAALQVARSITSIPYLGDKFIGECRKEPLELVYNVKGR